jgi:hypothetical protein
VQECGNRSCTRTDTDRQEQDIRLNIPHLIRAVWTVFMSSCLEGAGSIVSDKLIFELQEDTMQVSGLASNHLFHTPFACLIS